MKIIYSELFKKFPELAFGISTKDGGVSAPPYFMNMGMMVGDEKEKVIENRKLFLKELKIELDKVTFQQQVHSANINYVSDQKFIPDSDALCSDKYGVFLAVMIADCAPVFLYDPNKKVFAGIHSGWMGAKENISGKTVKTLCEKFKCLPENVIAFIGPCISGKNYEVGEEFKKHFGEDNLSEENGKFHLDLKKIIHHQLLKAGLKEQNIEVSAYCTYESEDLFHSHRREKGHRGKDTGRMMGVIGLRAVNNEMAPDKTL